MTLYFIEVGVFEFLAMEWSTVLVFVAGYAATSGLGFYAGIFGVGWLVLPACRHINGAPHKKKESVMVLSGLFSGKNGIIYKISRGQGGQPLPRVDLGSEAMEQYHDMFEEYSLLRISLQQEDDTAKEKGANNLLL